jgi:hypothetical protein
MLVVAYHLLSRDQEYSDMGADYFVKHQSSEAHARRLVRQLEHMDHKVTLQPAA